MNNNYMVELFTSRNTTIAHELASGNLKDARSEARRIAAIAGERGADHYVIRCDDRFEEYESGKLVSWTL